MTVALLAIMLDEALYVRRWISAVKRVPDAFDSVLVVDGGSVDGTPNVLREFGVPVVKRTFPRDFADQRNFALSLVETDWVLEVDADEVPSVPLLAGCRTIATDADEAGVDVVGVPRLNFIDDALVAGTGHRGLDYQYRLHRARCCWRGAVHEEVVGYRERVELRLEDGHFLTHDKTSARHEVRNAHYKTMR